MSPERPGPRKIPSGSFQEIYATGRKAVGHSLLLFFKEGGEGFAFAAVASRKIGNAVQRNRAKRLMREAFRTHQGRLRGRGAYVLIARAGILAQKSQDVADDLEKLLTRLDLLSEKR